MKYIFVTGGVVSSLGKGLAAASLGTLLEHRGLKVVMQKFDPYLNVDPGTMSPYQHGEVYVLDDGAETDLDLGHYERFTHSVLTRANNTTSGQVYQTVLDKERRGDYLGKTVQVIPHVTDEIKARLRKLSTEQACDIVITEIGGTTGDIEGLPFLEAIRQFIQEVGPGNAIVMHVTLVPFIKAAGELKTKPSQQSIAKLRENGAIYEKDGANWLRTTEFGDDKDRVVIKSDGAPAYIAADLAYYLDKRERGFDLCIYMLGADHHGYIARLKAAAAALGDDPDTVEVLIGQLVNLVRDGQPVRMSKRAGTVITLDDLVEAIGTDAARYALIRSSVDSPIDIDLALWSSASAENPVYYVQYAHARLCALARNAAELGLEPDLSHLAELGHDREGALIRTLGDYPRVLQSAAALREPHRVCRYLEDLAGDYHRFYDSHRVLPQGDESAGDVHRARLALCAATRQVIANGLDILGVSAPERM